MSKRKYDMEIEMYHKQLKLHKRKIIILTAILEELHHTSRKTNRWHVRPIFKERKTHGHYHCLLAEFQLSNSAMYYNFLRMSSICFKHLVQLIGPSIQRVPSRPDILSVGELLTCTLRYLASGDSMMDIGYAFRIAQPTVSKLIRQCCTTLWDILCNKVLMKPQTENWISIANEFNMKWNFPNCVGSIDGKHVVHQAFANSGSTNYNYKGTHSIILLAVCDASYCFTLVDIGAPGRCSDGGVFRNCNWGKQIINKTIDFPDAIEIDDENGPIPYCVVADEAFPLLTNVMRPYPGRSKGNLPEDQTIFNYRLSRARRTIENAFGILASKWRVFRSPIIGSEKTVIAITKAAVVLHNFVRIYEKNTGESQYCPVSLVDRYENGRLIRGQWRNDITKALTPIGQQGSKSYSAEAKIVREKLKKHFNGPGAINFQQNRNY